MIPAISRLKLEESTQVRGQPGLHTPPTPVRRSQPIGGERRFWNRRGRGVFKKQASFRAIKRIAKLSSTGPSRSHKYVQIFLSGSGFDMGHQEARGIRRNNMSCHVGTPPCQKRASDPITDGCEMPCGYWKLNTEPLEEQTMLLTAEPSLQCP